jgi:hypothetical protein
VRGTLDYVISPAWDRIACMGSLHRQKLASYPTAKKPLEKVKYIRQKVWPFAKSSSIPVSQSVPKLASPTSDATSYAAVEQVAYLHH